MTGNKNKKNTTPKQQQYNDNEVFVAPTSGPSTKLNSLIPDINVKRELVKQNIRCSIIDPEVQIISKVDKTIIDDTYGNNTNDLCPRDRKKLQNTIFQPIEIKFNEPHITDLPSKLGTQTSANDQQNTTQMQIDQPVVAPDHQSENPDKAHETALHFHQYDSFISVLPARKKNNDTGKLKNVITITFSSKDDFNKALNVIYRQKIVNTDNSRNEIIEYKEFSFTIKHREPIVLLPEQKEDEKSRIIQVIDIPLFLTKNVIQNAFSILGEIEKLNTTPNGQYQQAFITYINKDVVDRFYYKWSHLIGTYPVRVLLCFLSEEKREERKAFGLRLLGLPFGTNTSVLTEIIKQLNGRTCFIPRHPHTYKPMTYTYIQFSDQEQKDIAKQKLFKYTKGYIKNCILYLLDPTEKPKICNKCSSPDHIYEIKNNTHSYAQVAKSNINSVKGSNNSKHHNHTTNSKVPQKSHNNPHTNKFQTNSTKSELLLGSRHKKYLQELLNAAMLDIKDQISKEMSQIKKLFGNEIQEFKDQRINRFLDKIENEKYSSAKKTADRKRNLKSKLDFIGRTINTILNNFFNSFIKGEHAQYKTIELQEEYGKTDYKGDKDDVIDQ
ncbi:hypothetical protein GLOIN_2v1885182 [Rhizophagus clarus]|uniref:RRM domain-containing protein n=1 Tax=Rhizophagus clarus TaxID=94130 RepID=A0A8H3LNJ6_9GLOM|nr:hypothetical protein GLOIN_2v1885182 [Rhizophagus clarus]